MLHHGKRTQNITLNRFDVEFYTLHTLSVAKVKSRSKGHQYATMPLQTQKPRQQTQEAIPESLPYAGVTPSAFSA